MSDAVTKRIFLLNDDSYMNKNSGCCSIIEGYINDTQKTKMYIRRETSKTGAAKTYLTIEGFTQSGEASQVETTIKQHHYEAIFMMCDQKCVIKKFRVNIEHNHMNWVVDVFQGNNAGLSIATLVGEVTPDELRLHKPSFVGEEVTGDDRYSNRRLIQNPFNTWGVDK